MNDYCEMVDQLGKEFKNYMASTLDFMRYVHEQSQLGDRLTYKKMFGEYALYVNEKVVALVCDNSVFLKPTEQIKEVAGSLPLAPPYPDAKDYLVVDELLDDPEEFRSILLATEKGLPAAKAKKPKANKSAKSSTKLV